MKSKVCVLCILLRVCYVVWKLRKCLTLSSPSGLKLFYHFGVPWEKYHRIFIFAVCFYSEVLCLYLHNIWKCSELSLLQPWTVARSFVEKTRLFKAPYIVRSSQTAQFLLLSKGACRWGESSCPVFLHRPNMQTGSSAWRMPSHPVQSGTGSTVDVPILSIIASIGASTVEGAKSGISSCRLSRL